MNFGKELTMIVIKVWCLPLNQDEDVLNLLHQAIVKTVVSVSELGVKDENDMVCLFPVDLMKYGLGKEIIIEIDGLPDMPRKNASVPVQLAESVGKSVSVLYPEAKIKCSVEEFNPSKAVWISTKQKDR